jgi:hypothetical protein
MRKQHENVILTPAELRKRYELADRTRSILTLTAADLKGAICVGEDPTVQAAALKAIAERKKLLTRPEKKWYPMENKWR